MLYPVDSRVRHPIRGTGTVIALGRTERNGESFVNNNRVVCWDQHPIHRGKATSKLPRTTTVHITNLQPEFPITKQKETAS